jgi:UDP-glucuronate 4-epimerase
MPEQPGDVPVTFAEVNKARRLLGFEAKVSIEEGLARYVEWYRSIRMVRS